MTDGFKGESSISLRFGFTHSANSMLPSSPFVSYSVPPVPDCLKPMVPFSDRTSYVTYIVTEQLSIALDEPVA